MTERKRHPSDDRPSSRRPYHHGNLRAELIEASFTLLGEQGLAGFSVAQDFRHSPAPGSLSASSRSGRAVDHSPAARADAGLAQSKRG